MERYVVSSWTQTLPDGDTVEQVRFGWRCSRCAATTVSHFDDAERARTDPLFAAGLLLEQRWCAAGHLFDRPDIGPSWRAGRWTWNTSGRPTCAMCGLVQGSRPRRFVSVAPPVELRP